MKHFVFALALLVGAHAGATCPNLSGYYVQATREGSVYLEKIEQVDCDSVSFGHVITRDGKVTEEMFPGITYVNADHRSLCEGRHPCYRFAASETALTLFVSSFLNVKHPETGHKLECGYESIAYSLSPEGNLRVAYALVPYGPEDPCLKVGSPTEEYARVPKPL